MKFQKSLHFWSIQKQFLFEQHYSSSHILFYFYLNRLCRLFIHIYHSLFFFYLKYFKMTNNLFKEISSIETFENLLNIRRCFKPIRRRYGAQRDSVVIGHLNARPIQTQNIFLKGKIPTRRNRRKSTGNVLCLI